MRYCLNIGLEVTGGAKLSPFDILSAASHFELNSVFISASMHYSDTEETMVLVMDVPTDWVSELVYNMAVELGQEAIALVTIDPVSGWYHGRLVGPFAEKWGPFDPARFILPNGERAKVQS